MGRNPAYVGEHLESNKDNKGRSRMEPGTPRTRSASHTTTPNGQLVTVSYTRSEAFPLRVTRRVGWRNGTVGCPGCGGPAWHWPDASPGMTLATP